MKILPKKIPRTETFGTSWTLSGCDDNGSSEDGVKSAIHHDFLAWVSLTQKCPHSNSASLCVSFHEGIPFWNQSDRAYDSSWSVILLSQFMKCDFAITDWPVHPPPTVDSSLTVDHASLPTWYDCLLSIYVLIWSNMDIRVLTGYPGYPLEHCNFSVELKLLFLKKLRKRQQLCHPTIDISFRMLDLSYIQS